jgi:hypothetical protein
VATPYPKYEACAPTSSNRALREDELPETEVIPFIPYADEHEFPSFEYAEEAHYFAWYKLEDPDGENRPTSWAGTGTYVLILKLR